MGGKLFAIQVYLGIMRRAVKLQKKALAAVFERHGERPPVAANAGIVLGLRVVQRHLPRRMREIDARKTSLAAGKTGVPLTGEFPIAAKADHGVPP